VIALFASSEQFQCSGTAREIMQISTLLTVSDFEADAGAKAEEGGAKMTPSRRPSNQCPE
jgi:hypothetical protein